MAQKFKRKGVRAAIKQVLRGAPTGQAAEDLVAFVSEPQRVPKLESVERRRPQSGGV